MIQSYLLTIAPYIAVFALLIFSLYRILKAIRLQEFRFKQDALLQVLSVLTCMGLTLAQAMRLVPLSSLFVQGIVLALLPFFATRALERHRKPPILLFALPTVFVLGEVVLLKGQYSWYYLACGTLYLGITVYYYSRLLLRMTDRFQRIYGLGTVISLISAFLDLVYFLAALTVFGLVSFAGSLGAVMELLLCCTSLAAIAVIVVLAFTRYRTGRIFVFFEDHESVFVDSQRAYFGDPRDLDDMQHCESYEQLFVRIRDLFENNKPFLNPDLSVVMIAKSLVTNRMYVAKAISLYTGLNFCQYVNGYRVEHSMFLYRRNNALKLNDLALMSGFKSYHSYSMAFRLYLGMSPSDWCRAHRNA